MAYVGTTGASSVSNPPINLTRGIGTYQSTLSIVVGTSSINAGTTTGIPCGGGNGLWFYSSTELTSDIAGTAGYFTDGSKLGMRNGDVVICVTSTVNTTNLACGVGVVCTTNTTAGFRMSTGLLILSTV